VGGRAAVIVPNGVLFGSSNAHIKARKLLLESCDLQAIIAIPGGVFQPYSGVGTAVLVFVKGGKTEDVWFYEMKADGYSMDQKRDFIDGKGDIPDIVKKFRSGRPESKRSILVPFARIKNSDYNLSVSRYKQVEHEDVEYEEPEALIENVKRLEAEIAKDLQELRAMI
jgi:type I restriction enzyme M protein